MADLKYWRNLAITLGLALAASMSILFAAAVSNALHQGPKPCEPSLFNPTDEQIRAIGDNAAIALTPDRFCGVKVEVKPTR